MIKITKEQYKIAEKNGIGKYTVNRRVFEYEWSVEDAITKKIMTKAECRMKYPKYVYENLKKNNISSTTFNYRIFIGWEVDDACTIPIGKVRKYKKWKKENSIKSNKKGKK